MLSQMICTIVECPYTTNLLTNMGFTLRPRFVVSLIWTSRESIFSISVAWKFPVLVLGLRLLPQCVVYDMSSKQGASKNVLLKLRSLSMELKWCCSVRRNNRRIQPGTRVNWWGQIIDTICGKCLPQLNFWSCLKISLFDVWIGSHYKDGFCLSEATKAFYMICFANTPSLSSKTTS